MKITVTVQHIFLTPLILQGHTAPSAELMEINTKLNKVMALLDDLTAQVERNTEVDESAVLLLKGLKDKLDAAGTDPVKLKALSDQLGSSTDALAAAVAANTPGEPAE